MKCFDQRFHAGLMKNLPKKIAAWTECQAKYFDAAMRGGHGKDAVLHSYTGSGKTLAYLLPSVDRLVRQSEAGGAVVVIVPTRELATQVGKVCSDLTAGLDVQSTVLCGGLRVDLESMGPRVIVGTPGAILNNMASIAGSPIQTIIVDEVDRLLDFGFIGQLEQILRLLSSACRPSLVVASATFPPDVDAIVKRLVASDVITVREASGETSGPPGLKHELVQYEPINFQGHLEQLLSAPSQQSLVLFPTTRSLMFFYSMFKSRQQAGLHVHALHGRMLHAKRENIAEKFRSHISSDEPQILFSTDVAARGLDFPNLGSVFQIGFSGVDDPVSQFIHRSGRTARGGANGRNVLLVGNGLDAHSKWLAEIRQRVGIITPDRLPYAGELHEESTPYQRHLSTKCLESLLSWFLERRSLLGLRVDEELSGPARTMEAKAQLVRAVTDMVRSTGVPQPRISSNLAKKLRIDEIPGLLMSVNR